MTSRLKRKLNDLRVDTASTKATESFCLIGTPLPPLEKSKDTGEFVPLWKQEVRDEKGRRRLHGAFTGGFSAGYFNSVGSKEGWTPSTFVSSRSDRAKQRAVRPEDFMDEEDLTELRENRKLVDEHEEMDFGGTEAELRRRAGTGAETTENDSMASALEASFAPAPKDSAGARILRKMGWRVGQGVGPRVTYAQRKAQDAAVLGARGAREEEEDEEAKKHMFPRRDTPVLVASRKDNFHGVGYVPGMRLEESRGAGADEARNRGPSISAGFGLGALNDADEDDIDIYDGDTGKRLRTRMAYDIADVDDENHISVGSSRAKDAARGPHNRIPAASSQTFSDGRPVVKGFILSDRPVSEDRWFPLPEVPSGWKPNPRRVWEAGKNKENLGSAKAGQPKTHAEWKESFMSADQRGSLLGETPLPSAPRSVFEYISQKDRERLQNIRNTVPGTHAPQQAEPGPSPAASYVRGELYIPHLHPSVAKAALQGFQPFTTDPVKQSRYTAFLHFQASREDAPGDTGLGLGPLPGQSIDDFNKELEDYAKSATVFKPLSGAMAGRFRSAAIVENGPKIIEGLHQPDLSELEEEGTKEEVKEEEDPKMGAVRLGMYGPMTREVQPWQPARLLCKRFGVKDPEVDMTSVAGNASADIIMPTAAAQAPLQLEAGPSDAAVSASDGVGFVAGGTEGGGAGASRSGPRNLASIGLGEDEDQGRDTLTYERPAMDIFKAIFASDDEDSDGDEPEADERGISEDRGASQPAPGRATAEPSVLTAPPTSNSAAASYVPPTNGTAAPEKVDLATFKPTFVPRSERDSRKDKEAGKDKKDRKKKAKTTLSFDVEDDGFGPSLGAPKPKDKDRERKKKRRKERKEEDEDDSMWVEAPPPEAVKSLPLSVPSDVPSDKPPDRTPAAASEKEAGPPRGRKRAIDFM
ncbi:hypothetical protein CERSUDRAFT_104368 [Gelatoporia subvermispora B]|uniref:G-patch domain-containing protein n=1 Tax=Ceriporiopsis subvermispora (strain B) TaxID=914234 RepID=M2RKV1_CERS8|nr:hypothetical protein CERSUDRAFT_104368 [Gelatoporia subvermispora B]